MNELKVVVVGSINMDLVARSQRIPHAGETVIGGDFRTVPGGKGANQAVAARRLGAQVRMLGRVGMDPFGSQLLDNLSRAGVDTISIGRDPQAASGIALIMVDDAGQNSILVAPGANMLLASADMDAAEEVIASAQVMLLQLEIPLETVVRAVQIGHAHGVKVVLNPAPAQPLPPELTRLVDVLVPNEFEAALLTGLPVDSDEQIRVAASALRATGAVNVIITLGGRGALLATAEGFQHFPAFPVKPVDTTAAGDAFVGCLGAALAEGCTLEEAMRWGSAAGALSTTKKGAQPSLPQRKEVEKLLSGDTYA
ncbi:MAG: ribokinase [Anaerolineaceae bacterium]|jgi:ribokinase